MIDAEGQGGAEAYKNCSYHARTDMRSIGIGKWATVVAVFALTACGGGGGSSTPAPPPPSKTATFSGSVSTSKAMYFNGVQHAAAAAQRARALAVSPSCPGLNIDADGDGTPDTLVDVNGDCIADYSIVGGDKVGLIGATVTLTNTTTHEVITLVTNDQAHFSGTVPDGTYDIETRTKAADGAVIWGVQTGRTISSDSDAGDVGLSRNPVIAEVSVDGGSTGHIVAATYTATSSRKLSVGDSIAIHVKVEDPNKRPITPRAFSHLGAGYTELPMTTDSTGYLLNYTVAQTDAVLSTLEVSIELNNDDGFTGADQYRDALVRVSYGMNTAQSAPLLQGVTINGKAYDNAIPTLGMNLTADPVGAGAPIAFLTRFDATVSGVPTSTTYWYSGGVQQQSNDPLVTIPGSATSGVYNVKVTSVVYLTSNSGAGLFSPITIPVDTTDKPAQVAGVRVNGADPLGRVFKVGDHLTIKALGSDPQGRPLEYRFSFVGGASEPASWQSSDTIEHTVTAADVNAAFGIRVWVRNDDGRVLDGGVDFDASITSLITASE